MRKFNIDWNFLSKNKKFSKKDLEKYKNKINWDIFLVNNQEMITDDILEIGKQYFTKETYKKIAYFNLASSSFIRKYREKFDWEILITNSYLSENLLLDCMKEWENIPIEKLEKCFYKSRLFDITSGNYKIILLFLNLKNS